MEWNETGIKTYEIKQIDGNGGLVSTATVDAASGETAAQQIESVVDGARSIQICLDGDVMNEMGVDYWQKRVRRR